MKRQVHLQHLVSSSTDNSRQKTLATPLVQFNIFFNILFLWWLKSLLLTRDSKNSSSMAARFFYCLLQPAVICDSLRKTVKCLLSGPCAVQFLPPPPPPPRFIVSIFPNTVISRESFINTICLTQIKLCWVVLVSPEIWDIKGENKRNLPSNSSSQHSLEKLKAQTICRLP